MLCFSPSVLDRLNALLEPGGVLTIDERGVIDGQIPAIKPHPNFRFNYLNNATRAVARKNMSAAMSIVKSSFKKKNNTNGKND